MCRHLIRDYFAITRTIFLISILRITRPNLSKWLSVCVVVLDNQLSSSESSHSDGSWRREILAGWHPAIYGSIGSTLRRQMNGAPFATGCCEASARADTSIAPIAEQRRVQSSDELLIPFKRPWRSPVK